MEIDAIATLNNDVRFFVDIDFKLSRNFFAATIE